MKCAEEHLELRRMLDQQAIDFDNKWMILTKAVSSQADTFTPSQYYFNSDHNITSVEENLIINLLLLNSFLCKLSLKN